jgi:putative ABC transport system permease protein
MSDFWLDVRFGVRLLRRNPVFALAVVLLLGIDIGANTLIFSFVDTLLLRPFAGEERRTLGAADRSSPDRVHYVGLAV